MQTQLIDFTPAELVGALDALDVPFLAGGAPIAQLSPIELLQGLAGAPEARLRSAIIPLVLRHPEFSTDARAADEALSDLARITCECFYTAAVLLQRKYRDRLVRVFGAQTSLPDWFSAALGITLSTDGDASLRALGERQHRFHGPLLFLEGCRHFCLFARFDADRRRKRLVADELQTHRMRAGAHVRDPQRRRANHATVNQHTGLLRS